MTSAAEGRLTQSRPRGWPCRDTDLGLLRPSQDSPSVGFATRRQRCSIYSRVVGAGTVKVLLRASPDHNAHAQKTLSRHRKNHVSSRSRSSSPAAAMPTASGPPRPDQARDVFAVRVLYGFARRSVVTRYRGIRVNPLIPLSGLAPCRLASWAHSPSIPTRFRHNPQSHLGLLDRLCRNCAGRADEARGLPHRVADVGLVGDVVTVERGPGLVARDLHGHCLMHPSSDHGTDRRPPRSAPVPGKTLDPEVRVVTNGFAALRAEASAEPR